MVALVVLVGCGGDDPQEQSAVQIQISLEGEGAVPEDRIVSLRMSLTDSAGLGIPDAVPIADGRIRLLPAVRPDPDNRFRYCLEGPARIVDNATLETLNEIPPESCFIEGDMIFDGRTLEPRGEPQEDPPAG